MHTFAAFTFPKHRVGCVDEKAIEDFERKVIAGLSANSKSNLQTVQESESRAVSL
jgi:hypothetical protein